jgi:hypothetical protein
LYLTLKKGEILTDSGKDCTTTINPKRLVFFSNAVLLKCSTTGAWFYLCAGSCAKNVKSGIFNF